MKKFGLIFATSFITYPLVLFAAPYVTASLIADFALLFFLIAVCYQLIYIFFLRKKENIKFLKALSLLFLYISFCMQAYIIISYIFIAINGFTPSDILGNAVGNTIYGIKAIFSDKWTNLVFVPVFIICAIYQLIFLIITKNHKKHQQEQNRPKD